jgi:hypothetical protein
MGIVFRENELYGNMNFYGYFLSNVSGSASMPNQLINNVVSCNFSATTPRAFYFSTSATDGLDYLEMHHNSFEARESTAPRPQPMACSISWAARRQRRP